MPRVAVMLVLLSAIAGLSGWSGTSAAAVLKGSLDAPANPAPSPQRVSAAATQAAAQIAFEGVKLLVAEPGGDEREVTLRFAQPLDARAVETLPQALPDWIEFATPGYDSLLIRTRKKAAYSVEQTPGGFVLRLAWTADAEELRGRNVQQLRYLTAAGETERARAVLADLRKARYDAKILDRAEADLLIVERDPRAAMAVYDRLAAAEPGDENVLAARAALRRTLGPEVGAALQIQQIEDGDRQTIATLRGRTGITPRTTLTAELRLNDLSDGAVLRPDGAIVAVSAIRQRLEAGVEVDEGGGQVWTPLLFASGAGPGVGLRYELRGPHGETILRAAINEPYWGAVEAVAFDGARDSVEAALRWRSRGPWYADLGLRLSRYRLDADANVAQTAALEAGVRYEHKPGGGLTYIFSYALDAEYVLDLETRTTGLGALYNPLPLADREVHMLTAGLFADLSEAFAIEGAAGYAYDRFGEGGIFARAGLIYQPDPLWRMSANASYAEVTSRGSGSGGGALVAAGVEVTVLLDGQAETAAP
jgi:hypothetical protein